jgi:hypothetical protein
MCQGFLQRKPEYLGKKVKERKNKEQREDSHGDSRISGRVPAHENPHREGREEREDERRNNHGVGLLDELSNLGDFFFA